MNNSPRAPRVGMVSLGCPKALVDSERIVTQLRTDGYELSPDYEGADVVIVNTCGFIDSARAESLEAIGEAVRHPRCAPFRTVRFRAAAVRTGYGSGA